MKPHEIDIIQQIARQHGSFREWIARCIAEGESIPDGPVADLVGMGMEAVTARRVVDQTYRALREGQPSVGVWADPSLRAQMILTELEAGLVLVPAELRPFAAGKIEAARQAGDIAAAQAAARDMALLIGHPAGCTCDRCGTVTGCAA